MVDSHCHLTDSRLLEQLDAVLSRAAAAGVGRMITIGTHLADSKAAIALCEKHSQIRCAIGIHPNYCHEAEISDIDAIRELESHTAVVALGEMGLDYHYTFAPHDRQRAFFESQLQLATDRGRNVIIHCREAVDDTLAILRGFSNKAVFHCFTGSRRDAESILAAGHWISYTGVITFKKNDALRECVRITPRDRLMVETDAPYLSPEPFRSQKVNEPSMVIHTATVVAREWGVAVDEVDRVTTENVGRFFACSAAS
jgi:TatD DNase family protein